MYSDARERDRARNDAVAGGYYAAPAQASLPSLSKREVDIAELANFEGDNVEELMNQNPRRF